jgi:hypothetical protein
MKFYKGQKMTAWNKGKKLNDSHRQALSESHSGIKNYNFGKVDEQSSGWKGDKIAYSSLHQWVVRKLGQPNFCEKCGTKKAKRFEWANVSLEYKRLLSDWLRLCISCHHKLDKTGQKSWETRRLQDA